MRGAVGESNFKAKVTEQQAIAVIKDRADTGDTARAISARHGLPYGIVAKMLAGDTWKHINRKAV